MLLCLALTFRDFRTIALIFRLAQLPKDLEERRHEESLGVVLELSAHVLTHWVAG